MTNLLSLQKKRTYFIARFLLVILTFVSIFSSGRGQTTESPFPVKRTENRAEWERRGRLALEQSKQLRARLGRTKNVILFVGDGMGITTITAARILEGQIRGESGEENSLSFERLPYLALSKTYSVNQQTSDSAPTMTAMVTGVKTDDGVLSIDQRVVRGDHTTVQGNELKTILELAEERGLSTGVVSTARVTHATPAACYAHSPERDWESDKNLSEPARAAGFRDIARQLIEFPYGDGLEVALGGGRSKFFPKELLDPESNTPGERLDKRDLTEEWVSNKTWAKKGQTAKYVWNKQGFDNVDATKTTHLLGLFEPSHMKYEYDRRLTKPDKPGEPSLTEMTNKAVDILAKNPKGYFLMVEAGRIDHAHHAGNAYRALTEAIELSNAVEATLKKVNLSETLVIVTADHSHVFTMAGYPTRGNNILGLVRKNDEATGQPSSEYAKDSVGRPYTTLGYANGPGYTGATTDEKVGQMEGPKRFPHDGKMYSYIKNGRPDLTNINTADPDYMQESTLPLHYDSDPRKGFGGETHGGEDVAIFAGGPAAYLFHGVQEQSYIFYVMYEALNLSRSRR